MRIGTYAELAISGARVAVGAWRRAGVAGRDALAAELLRGYLSAGRDRNGP